MASARLTGSSGVADSAGLVHGDDLQQRADGAHDQRLLHRHRLVRLEGRDQLRDAIVRARDDEDVDRPVVAQDVAMGHPTGEDDGAVVEAHLVRDGLQVRPCLAVAHEQEADPSPRSRSSAAARMR